MKALYIHTHKFKSNHVKVILKYGKERAKINNHNRQIPIKQPTFSTYPQNLPKNSRPFPELFLMSVVNQSVLVLSSLRYVRMACLVSQVEDIASYVVLCRCIRHHPRLIGSGHLQAAYRTIPALPTPMKTNQLIELTQITHENGPCDNRFICGLLWLVSISLTTCQCTSDRSYEHKAG